MTGRSTYKAAKAVAATIEKYFVQLRAEAEALGEINLAPQPLAPVIETMLDVAFWASLRKEEGFSPRLSLAYLQPEQAVAPLLFETPLEFAPYLLAKIGPGVGRAGVHLGVWYNENGFYVWGTTQHIPPVCLVLNVPEPGLVVVKHMRLGGYGKFTNVAVLKGDRIKIIDENISGTPDCPTLLTSLVGSAGAGFWTSSVNVLVQLAVNMRAHGKGGTLLVVPVTSTSWRDSIIFPLKYEVWPPFGSLSAQMQQQLTQRDLKVWQSELSREVKAAADLTAIDGATIMNDRYEVLAFGAKIKRPQESEPVEKVIITEPVVGHIGRIVDPAQHGGTRHLSAAQFVHDQHDALALVASQDGRFTIFAWSPCENMVHAHRIDALLL